MKITHYIQQIKNGRLETMLNQLKWIYSYARRHVLAIILYTAIGLSGTVITLSTSLVSKDLVDIITGHHTGKLLHAFILMISFQLINVAIGQLSGYVSSLLTIKVNNNIKADIYDKIMTSEWESLSRYHSGDISARWSGDSSIISMGILTIVPNAIQVFFRFVSALIMVISYDASFAVFALISAPVTMLVSRHNLKRMQQTNMGYLSINTKLSAFTIEAFSNFQNVKAFHLVPQYMKKLRGIQDEQVKANLHYQKASCINALLLAIVTSLVTYSTYGWGIYKVWSGAITYGTMTMFLTLSNSLAVSVQSLLQIIPTTINVTNAAKRLMDISTLPKEDYSQETEVAAFYKENVASGIGLSVRGLSYTYPTGTKVFNQITFDAHPNETIALVGPSGEGKTTMLRLFLALIHGQIGQGYICSGQNTPESDTSCMPLSASTRQLFAYVPQGNTMFSGTIADNMRNVKEDATDEEIIHALELACAWDFVSKLPDSINTMMQERGGGFSEGQAQRLSIARALIRRSPILLLDEATSALDVYTEKKVLQNIMQDDYPRTTIVTTHRPSVLSVCTRVYAIRDKGCDVMGQAEIEDMANAYK